jgi:predicted permease
MPGIADLRRDFVYGARLLAKSPGFTTVAVLSLALGIGANTAIFSLIDSVLLKLLPVKDPQQLVALTDPTESGTSIGTSTGERGILSTREFEALRDRTQSFSGMLAAQSEQGNRNTASIDGHPPEELRTRLVSGGYFTVLGATTAIGRAFTADDERGPGSAPFAVISYAFWQRRFGGSAAALGSRVHIAKADLTIIGVAQAHFLGEAIGDAPDLWIPLAMQPQIMPGRMWLEDDPAHIAEKVMWLHVIGRLKPGISRKQAQANVDVVFKQVVAEEFSKISQSQPGILKQNLVLHDAGAGVSSLRGNMADPLYVLMAVVALVLVIACANVANLLLARATARQKEMGVRLALGAGRARIVRQFLTESLMLSVAGGVLGSLLAVYGVQLLVALVSDRNGSAALDARPDLRVLFFTIGVSLLTGLIFGLAPAWRSARVNVSSTLKEAGRGNTGSGAKIGAGKILVIGQIALSVMLLIGAGWFLRTLRNLENVDLGYPRDKLALVGVDFLSGGYSGERLPIAYNEVRERLARIPGVRAVAYSQNGLFSGSESGDKISVEGYKSQKPQDLHARWDAAGPNYFATVGIPILLGRDIGPQDVESAESVCVVNEAFAKFYFGTQNPIGKHVTDEFPDTRKTFTIVGVARDARDHSLRREIFRRFYLSALQPLGGFAPDMNYEIRTFGEPGAVIQAARKAILAYDPSIPIGRVQPFVEMLDDNMRQERIIAQLSTVFGGVALLLAAIGLYGVLSYAVAQRTNEIGIRMALGAERGAVVRMILRETALLIVIGLAIGIPASLACARLVQSKLFGLKPADPLTLVGALVIMILVAVASGYLPARRASRVDPLIALRYE